MARPLEDLIGSDDALRAIGHHEQQTTSLLRENPWLRTHASGSSWHSKCGGNTISDTVDDHSNLQFSGWLELMSTPPRRL